MKVNFLSPFTQIMMILFTLLITGFRKKINSHPFCVIFGVLSYQDLTQPAAYGKSLMLSLADPLDLNNQLRKIL